MTSKIKVVIQYHWYNPKDSRDLIYIYLSNWLKRCRWQRWHTLPLWYVFTFIYFLHIFGKPSKLQYPKTIKTKVSSQSRLRICRPHGCNTTLWSHESSAAGGDCKPEIRKINIWNEFKTYHVWWFFVQKRPVSGEWQWRGGRNSCEVNDLNISFHTTALTALSFFLPQGTWVKVARNIKKPWTGQEAVSRFIPYALYRTQLKERILAHQAGISGCWDDAIQDLTRHQILKTLLHRWMPVFSFAIL